MSIGDMHDDADPIDVVKQIAQHNQWDYDVVADGQIAMAVEGQWRTYSTTMAWSPYDETLRLICTFELQPPEDSQPKLFELLNLINDQCWTGSFTYWTEQQLIVYRYGLILAGGNQASPEQIEAMINTAVLSCERFYPAIQMCVGWKESQASLGRRYLRSLWSCIKMTLGRAL